MNAREVGAGSAITLTAHGALVGTPACMAPEQLRGGVDDARSDLFSFCVTFWEALFGERPFAGRDLDELRASVTAGAIRPPPEGRGVPEPLHDALRRGLQPMPGLGANPFQAIAPGPGESSREERFGLFALRVAGHVVAAAHFLDGGDLTLRARPPLGQLDA